MNIHPYIWAGMYIKPPKYDEPEEIIELVCEQYRLNREQLNGHCRITNIREARQVCMFLIKRTIPKTTHDTIGRLFGGFDHTTVTNSIKMVLNQCDTDEQFKAMMDKFADKMKYPNNYMKDKLNNLTSAA